MRPSCLLVLFGVVTLAPATSFAQEAPAYNIDLRAHAGLIANLGEWSDASGPPVGLMVGAVYGLTPELAVTARAGYFYGIPRSEVLDLGMDLASSSPRAARI